MLQVCRKTYPCHPLRSATYPQGPLAWAGRWGLRTVLTVLTVLDELENWYRDGHYRASPLLRRAALAGTMLTGTELLGDATARSLS